MQQLSDYDMYLYYQEILYLDDEDEEEEEFDENKAYDSWRDDQFID